MNFKLPTVHSRTSICGMTGSGKTQFALWLFSFSEFDKRPYVIVDFKRDSLIAQLPSVRELTLKQIPKQPGLYVLRPRPDQDAEVSAWLWKIWERGNIGLWFDEGYMLKNDRALNAILTQGRSLKIPCMILTQRPTYCSRFVFSEANFFAVFHLNDKRDYDIIRGFTPSNQVFDFSTALPQYSARWYDVSQRYSAIIAPVESDGELLEKYREILVTKIKRV